MSNTGVKDKVVLPWHLDSTEGINNDNAWSVNGFLKLNGGLGYQESTQDPYKNTYYGKDAVERKYCRYGEH